MKLVINNPDSLDLDDFISWLLKDIAKTATKKTMRNLALESVWSEYFKNTDFGWVRDSEGNTVVPTIDFIISQFFKNLVVKKDSNSYIITDNSNIFIRGTSIPIELLASVMNDGTLDTPPYPYFDFIFDLYSKNLQELYDMWIDGLGDDSNRDGEQHT